MTSDAHPTIRVVFGSIDPEESAALVVALLSLRVDAAPRRTAATQWSAVGALRRSSDVPPRSWRASGLPR